MLGPHYRQTLSLSLIAFGLCGMSGVLKAVETRYDTEVEAGAYQYLAQSGNREDALLFGEVLLGASAQWAETPWSFKGSLRFQADSENYTNGSALFIDDGLRRPYVSIDEAYLQYLQDRWEFRVGNQYFADGEGEFHSLTDQINARDLLDLPDSRRLPSLSAAGFYYGRTGTFRTVIVPVFTPSRIPQAGDRWFPELALMGPTPTFTGRELPSRNLENIQGGLQWKNSHLIPAGDISLQVFRGIDTVGVYRVNPMAGPPGLTRVFPRYTEWSAAFRIVHERYAFYGELGYHDTDNNTAEDDYVENLFGVSIDLTDHSPGQLEDLRVFFEYAGETTVNAAGGQGLSGRFYPTGQFTRPLQNSIILGFRGEKLLRFKFDGGFVLNLDHNDWYLRLGTRFRTRAGIWISLYADFLNGSGNSFFGRWRENDRVSLSLQYQH